MLSHIFRSACDKVGTQTLWKPPPHFHSDSRQLLSSSIFGWFFGYLWTWDTCSWCSERFEIPFPSWCVQGCSWGELISALLRRLAPCSCFHSEKCRRFRLLTAHRLLPPTLNLLFQIVPNSTSLIGFPPGCRGCNRLFAFSTIPLLYKSDSSHVLFSFLNVAWF